MAIRKTESKSKPWLVECYPQGRNGKRIRKRFGTKGEAVIFENQMMNQSQSPEEGKPDTRKVSELIEIWHSAHGSTLASGDACKSKFLRMLNSMGDPDVQTFTKQVFAEFRGKRVSGEISFVDKKWRKAPPSLSTINAEHARFKAAINKLISIGEWKTDNPLNDLAPFPTNESEMGFLTDDDLELLLTLVSKHKNKDLSKIVKLCLSTGARWSEATSLKGSQLQVISKKNGSNKQYLVTYIITKSKKSRTVPISEELYNEIYKPTSGLLFDQDCYNALSYILKNKLNNALPKNQATHVLRHTFASHFMMNGGNIIVLKDILGHSEIKMTMRYAHFAPDHLSDAIVFNPLSNI
ncbi:phage integrase [Vibrio breoganii]|uniref:phage integrase n=1 Tax=Vibrio breoganii TaxID=553239 RepID=UPI0021C3D1B9|nr:tyrosine-type recombinase/integrase [Vibrio breoganii]MDN3716567.1 tyrosine-type recombinase/integrase [Vibrio breoganii]